MINQTVTIVNKSGKIVSTSKHLVNVFNEAKSAYNERKAEIRAMRKNELESKEQERRARKQLEALALEDDEDDRRSHRSHRSSRRGSEDGRSTVKRKPASSRAGTARPPVERGISDSFYANDRSGRSQVRPSPLRRGISAEDDEPQIKELSRRHTDGMQLQRRHSSHNTRRRNSAESVDMDLAYGNLPPPLPESKREDEIELQSRMNYLQRLLDEGNCVQHTVTATIDNLQKNPDALAAVALTLAEISNLVAKMAPGALATLKTSFPAIVALLASPQFAIAAGVGVGVTIIALGGYKIIKKIKARDSEERLVEPSPVPVPAAIAEQGEEPPMEEMDSLREISRIEKWRRGIADEQANSLGTSVDGEFITPVATRTLIDEGRLTEADLKPPSVSRAKSVRSSGTTRTRKSGHRHSSSKSTAGAKTEVSSGGKTKVKSTIGGGGERGGKKKEPSILKSLFKGQSGSKRERERERVMEYA